MARYIDADYLKERLLKISVVADDLYGMGINRGLDRAETEIDMAPTVDVATDFNVGSKSEWISVDERLPKPFISVLVFMPGEAPCPTVREGFVNQRGRWYAGGFDRLPDEVVMWKEMPEAPKMKGGEG